MLLMIDICHAPIYIRYIKRALPLFKPAPKSKSPPSYYKSPILFKFLFTHTLMKRVLKQRKQKMISLKKERLNTI